MKGSVIVLIAAVGVLLIPAWHSFGASVSEDAMAAFEKRFDEMDTNGDGKIDQTEYVQYEIERAKERFRLADENSDGFITRKEAERTMKKNQAEMMKRVKEWKQDR